MEQGNHDPWSMAAITYHSRWLKPYILATVGDPADADDILQEAFHIAYEKRESFAAGTNFGGWLRQIARNCVLRHFERKKRVPVVAGKALIELEKAASNWERTLTDDEWCERRKEALRHCLSRLERKARQVVELRYALGKSAERVASQLGMSLAAVYSIAFRSRAALAGCVRRKLEE